MALLLAMYQKMRLIREKNQATYDLTKYSSKLDRVTKNIERVQKRYTSLFAQLESQAKMMQSNATMFFQQAAGLGMNNFGGNVLNPQGFGGMNGFVYGVMQNMFNSNITGRKDADGNALPDIELGSDLFKKMYAEYMQNGGQFAKVYEKGDDGKKTTNVVTDENGNPTYESGYSHEQVQAFFQAQQAGQMQQQQAQMWVQNANQQYGNNVSIWLEAAKAQLEAEQDAALEPLNYQETMWELEKTQADNKLKRINAQLESYDQLVSQESEKSAPTFGLR